MFKEAPSNFNIEQLLGASLEDIDEIIENKDAHIRRLSIPKKSGGLRSIIVPDKKLKYIQKGIYWRILKKYKPSDAAHGFVSKRGIVTNARLHVGASTLGKIDIKNFFDTISTDHLKNCLFGNKILCRSCKHYVRMMDGLCNPSLYHNKVKNYEFKCEEIKAVFIPDYCTATGYQSLITRVIELCTFNNFCAQGFPTSPVLANIVMRGFDKAMLEFSAQHNITYSRYADDLAFSSKTLGKSELAKLITNKAYQQLWAYNFRPNKKKTSWKGKAGRLKVCGIVVNKKTSIQKNVVRKFRSKVHHATVIDADKTTKKMIRKLKGWASYLMSVNQLQGRKYMDKLVAFEKSKFKSVPANDVIKVGENCGGT